MSYEKTICVNPLGETMHSTLRLTFLLSTAILLSSQALLAMDDNNNNNTPNSKSIVAILKAKNIDPSTLEANDSIDYNSVYEIKAEICRSLTPDLNKSGKEDLPTLLTTIIDQVEPKFNGLLNRDECSMLVRSVARAKYIRIRKAAEANDLQEVARLQGIEYVADEKDDLKEGIIEDVTPETSGESVTDSEEEEEKAALQETPHVKFEKREPKGTPNTTSVSRILADVDLSQTPYGDYEGFTKAVSKMLNIDISLGELITEIKGAVRDKLPEELEDDMLEMAIRSIIRAKYVLAKKAAEKNDLETIEKLRQNVEHNKKETPSTHPKLTAKDLKDTDLKLVATIAACSIVGFYFLYSIIMSNSQPQSNAVY